MIYQSNYPHFWLYAKHWYKQSDDIVMDLRKLVANYCGGDVEGISTGDCFNLVFSTLQEAFHIRVRIGDERMLFNLIRNLWQRFNPLFPQDKQEENKIILLQEMLSALAMVSVIDGNKNKIIEFGSPDPAVLPLERT